MKFSVTAITLLLSIYLLIPSPEFPLALPPESLASDEPGDIKSPLVKAYFADLSREQILAFHSQQFQRSQFINIKLPTLRLDDYPPEETSLRITDQIKSSFLEELVHPLRESLFISGWEPKEDKDAIIVNNRRYKNKVTIKYYPSNTMARLMIGVGIAISISTIYTTGLNLFKSDS